MPTEGNLEPLSHITGHLTGGTWAVIEERTRVLSWPEKDYLGLKIFLGNTLAIPFYLSGAKTYMQLNISKDGLSRTEDVELGKGMNNEEKGRDVGWKVLKKVFGGADDSGSGKPQ
jgi:hypothetical protein